MNIRDVVYLTRDSYPVVGEVRSFTPKRVWIVIRTAEQGYLSVLRHPNNVKVAKKARFMK